MLPFPHKTPQATRVDPNIIDRVFDTVNPLADTTISLAVSDCRRYVGEFKRLAHNPPQTSDDMELLRKAADFAHACLQVAIMADAEKVLGELRRAGTLDNIVIPAK